MILPLALILCFTLGCQDKEAMAELEAMKAQAEVEEQNKELIRNYLREMDKQNFEIFNEVYAPDAKIYYPSNSSEPMSNEQAVPMAKSFYAAFPDFSGCGCCELGSRVSAKETQRRCINSCGGTG